MNTSSLKFFIVLLSRKLLANERQLHLQLHSNVANTDLKDQNKM